ncbi:MAG: U32 family peptidase [Methanomassiliicoccales archaeon]|nr:U32 family peptidase [Methanomassiliicoccales archaeon]
MELLAPAGSKDSLKAAILGGADAVYLAGKQFGARRLAENFTDSELKGALALAHDNHVKVFATVNTLVKENELSTAFSYLDYLSSIEVDAVIVQDRGIVTLIKDNFSMPIHASTQMGIHSPECIVWAAKQGIERVILARELNFEQLEMIRNLTEIELEVFVHGALCYSVSGKCLFSSILGGRSGNRGLCAQPCRKTYLLGNEKGYLLSTADLFSIESISRLMAIGIDALKIEGRMRSPVYVYLATKTYAKAIGRAQNGESALVTPRERELLEVVFNRGYTDGYLSQESVLQRDYPDSRGLFLGVASIEHGILRVFAENLKNGDGVSLYRSGKKLGGLEIKDIDRRGKNSIFSVPFRIDDGEYLIYKTKDTYFDSVRQMISALEFPCLEASTRRLKYELVSSKRKRSERELSFYVSSLKSLDKALPYASRIYFEWNRYKEEARSKCRKSKIEFVLMMPGFSTEIPDTDCESVMVSTLGQADKYTGRRLYGHYSLNFFNSLTIPNLHQYTLSVELSREDIFDLTKHYEGRLEALVFGKIELMLTKDPTLNEGTLVDMRGKKFPVYRDNFGFAHVLNSSDLFLLEHIEEMMGMGIESYGLDLRRRSAELTELVAKAFYEGDEELKDSIKRKCGSITAGHYSRGVL